MMVKCADIMTSQLQCHEASASIDQIAQTMAEKDIGPVPIVESVESMKLIGIVTDRDIAVKAVAKDLDLKSSVERIMTSDPVTCNAQDDVDKALQVMEECQVRRVPVVDAQNRLVGIIAQADIALRLKKPAQTAELLEEISKDNC